MQLSRKYPATQRITITLLDLVAAAAEVAGSEQEAILILRRLLASGRVRLVGEFGSEHLAAFTRGPVEPVAA